MTSLMKFAGAAVLASSLASTSAVAADLTLTHLQFDNSSTVYVNGVDVYLGEADFTALVGGKVETIRAFCIDFYHDITLGPLDLQYDRSKLETYSNGALSGTGTTMDLGTAEQIGGLANYGIASTDPIVQEAVQALIWKDMGATLSGFGSNGAAIQSEMTNLEGLDLSSGGRPGAIYAVNGLTQGFTTGGVPEPALWATMLLGLGAIGAAMRDRRRPSAPA